MTTDVFKWREHLAIHPAADMFPLLSESELKELADDIRQNGLQQPIVIAHINLAKLNNCGVHIATDEWRYELLDGRNRMDALARLGWLSEPRGRKGFELLPSILNHSEARNALGAGRIESYRSVYATEHADSERELYELALSFNAHRRHLTAEQKRELIGKLLKAQPESSDRTIAKTVTADHKTVAAVRSEMEGRGDIPHVETRTDSKGRKQPSTKPQRGTAEQIDLQPSEDADASAEAAFDIEIRHVSVPLDRVIPTTPERIENMKKALATDGRLLSPILIRLADNNSYRVVAGATRFEAAKALGWQKIEAIMFHGTPNEFRLAEVTDNKNRRDLTAEELRRLRDEETRLLPEIKRETDARAAKRRKDEAAAAEYAAADSSDDAASDCDGPVDFWQRSLSNMAGDAIAMTAYWDRQFGDWTRFDVAPDVATLAKQAAEAWANVARITEKRACDANAETKAAA